MSSSAKLELFMGRRAGKVFAVIVVVLSLCLLTGYMLWPRTPPDLVGASLYPNWDKGNVVVLVRHAERCNRSSNPCLASADGITVQGRDASITFGKFFSELGLVNTDFIASPAIRTEQTAFYMFGHPVVTQEWLSYCDKNLLSEVIAHKASQRNLILVTHSECISQLESEQGYAYADASEYNSALFVSLDDQGKPTIQGVLNPEDWKEFAKRP